MNTNQTTETNTEVKTECIPSPQGAEQNVNSITTDERGSHKLTDEQFIAELELNLGLYSQTASSIQKHYGIKYSRQAVRERAISLHRIYHDYRDTVMDNAKQVLLDSLTGDTDQKIKVKVALFLMSNKGNGNL